MEIYTIGFTKKSAEEFFTKLIEAKIRRLIDVRLNNTSQLAAFTKQEDLKYFLGRIGGIEYIHLPILAPTQEILDAYKKQKGEWIVYQELFLDLMKARKIEKEIPKTLFSKRSVLLCSENEPDNCHRRLVAEYLQSKWKNVKINHL